MGKVILSLMIFGTYLNACLADDGYFGGRGSAVFPSANTDIRMVSEKVMLKLESVKTDPPFKIYKVLADCQFTFVNPGVSAVITMGFPAEIDEREAQWDAEEAQENDQPVKTPVTNQETVLAHDFKTYVDGVEVPSEIREIKNLENIAGLNFHHAFLWPVKLLHDQPVHLHHTYNFKTSAQFNSSSVSYILKTGALWAGKMDKAEIAVDLGKNVPGYLLEVEPGGCTYENGVLRWLFTDFKPSDDILVTFYNKAYIEDELRKSKNAGFYDEFALKEIRLLRNAIYASHGKIFKSRDLKDYFSKQVWYHPDPQFKESMLTPEEKGYVERIREIEQGK